HGGSRRFGKRPSAPGPTPHLAKPFRSRRIASLPGRSPRWREHLALADMVGGADHAVVLHALDDSRRTIVADLQMALHKARRGLAAGGDGGRGPVIKPVSPGRSPRRRGGPGAPPRLYPPR